MPWYPPFWLPPLVIFLISLIVALVTAPLSIWIGRRWMLMDRPGGRRTHGQMVPRSGGIALFLAFFCGAGIALILWPPTSPEDMRRLFAVLTGSGIVFLFGLWDDRRELPAWPQFLAQASVALVAAAGTVFIERFTNPLTGQLVIIPDLVPYVGWGLVVAITLFWVMGMINTVNWLDGLDGLAAGVGCIAAVLFAIHSFRLGQAEIALFPTALAGACLGFLPFNFHPARVFMGTSGAMLLGYALATLSILAPARIATALLVLGVPIVDVAWIIVQRWRRGVSATQSGRDHLHHRLLQLGLSQRQIVGLYYMLCIAFGAMALVGPSPRFKLVVLGVLSLGVLSALAWLSRRP